MKLSLTMQTQTIQYSIWFFDKTRDYVAWWSRHLAGNSLIVSLNPISVCLWLCCPCVWPGICHSWTYGRILWHWSLFYFLFSHEPFTSYVVVLDVCAFLSPTLYLKIWTSKIQLDYARLGVQNSTYQTLSLAWRYSRSELSHSALHHDCSDWK